MKKKTDWAGIIILVVFIVGGAAAFTLDDVTVIGQLLDFFEFLVMAAVGLYGGKVISKIKK